MKKSKHFTPGDKVFAKVKGYPAWPARVEEEQGKRYKVFFYGTGETGIVKAEDLFSYVEHKEQFTKPLKRKDYNEALEEIEAAIQEDDSSKTPKKIAVVKEDSENAKQGVKRKMSSEALAIEPEPKTKKISPAKTENKKIPQANAKKDVSPTRQEAEDGNKKTIKASGKKVLKRKKSNASEELEESIETETEQRETIQHAKFVVVSSDQLQKTIDECSKIMMQMDDKEEIDEIPEDLTSLESDAILLARIEYGKYIGIKLNINRPTHFKNGVERLQWAVDNSQRVLDLKEKVEFSILKPEDEPDLFEINPELTKEQLENETSARIMERKKNKLLWLKIESCLVELDALIKTSLGLDKADPEKALKHLDDMLDLTIDPLMLKKHPHVVDMIKRLRRYIGNVKEWKLKDKELIDFKKQAEEIRNKAEKVYSKFKNLFQVPENSSFGEVFQQAVNKFKMQTKDMAESQVFALCAEPGSKQAQWDELDDQEEMKLISEKLGKTKDKENISENANNEKDTDNVSDKSETADNHG